MTFKPLNCPKYLIYGGAIFLLTTLLVGCTSPQGSPSSPSPGSPVRSGVGEPGEADQYIVVHCLLPGQLRRLGTQVTYVTARRPIKTTSEDCAIRGGEYVAENRANYATALKIWLEPAKKGNAEAQYYVGTLYEKGVTGVPNYSEAATWYLKAAKQGYSRAAINLGRLHENGLGFNKDSARAFKWYV